MDRELESTGHYLRTVIERMQQHVLREAGVPPDLDLTWSSTLADDVASGILQAAEGSERGAVASPCQVIAMAAHGYGGQQH